MRVPVVGSLLGGATLLVATAFLTPWSHAAAQASDITEGSLVTPDRPQTGLRSGVLLSASDHYVVHEVSQYDEYRPLGDTVVRISDGRTVATVPTDQSQGYTVLPTMVNDQLVSMTQPHALDHPVWTVSDPETGAVSVRRDLGAFGSPLKLSDRWALVYGSAAEADPSTHDPSVDLVRADGTHVVVHHRDGTPLWTQDLNYVAGDENVAYLTSYFDVDEVDISTGVVTQLALPGPLTFYDHVALTPHRILFWSRVYDNQDHYVVSWIDRQSGAQGTVNVPFGTNDRGLLPLGDGVAQMTSTTIPASPPLYDLTPIEPDGTPGAVAVHAIDNALPTPDGRLLAVRAGEGSGELVAVTAGEPASVGDVTRLPVLDDQATGVWLSRGTTYAGWDDGPQTVALDPAVGAWTAVSPAQDADGEAVGGSDVAGDVVSSIAEASGLQHTYVLSWPGGQRTTTAQWLTLGRGGTYLVRVLPDGSATQVEDVRTGRVMRTLAANAQAAVDGDELWRVDGTTVRGEDLQGQSPDRVIPVDASCRRDLELLAVVGRWAEIDCVGTREILDLDGSMGVWPVPRQVQQFFLPASLGGDAFGWTESITDADDRDEIVLHVVDFTAQHEERTYGPLRGQQWPPGASFAFDDDGSHRLVYVDPRSQIRSVNLTWLQVPSLSDVPTPTVPTPTTLPVPTPSGTLTPTPANLLATLALGPVGRPRGQARVGRVMGAPTLRSSLPTDATETFQWYRVIHTRHHRVVIRMIDGAQHGFYRLTRLDRGTQVFVQLTVRAAGYEPGSATSGRVAVR